MKGEIHMSITVIGKLVYNEEGKYDVEMLNEVFCLSDVLAEAYYSAASNHINLQIMDRDKILFQENDIIYRKPNQYGVYSYFIAGNDLETVLFDNTDKIVEVKVSAEAVVDYAPFFRET